MDAGAREGTGGIGIVDPRTGLASDYTNHLAGVAMLVELLPQMPDFAEEILAWRPLSYEAYFQGSPLSTAGEALDAYARIGPETRAALEAIVTRFDETVARVQRAIAEHPDAAAEIAARAAPDLTTLTADLAALINGTPGSLPAAAA